MIIRSAANPRLRQLRRLHTRRARTQLGLFIAEGEDLLTAALAAGVRPVEVLAVPDADVPDAAGEVVRVEPKLLAAVSSLEHPSRVVSVFRRDDLPRGGVHDLAVSLHGVRDPGNVGTLTRSLAALGPGALHLSGGCCDPTAPGAVRASMGAVFHVPLVDHDPAPALRVALDTAGDVELRELDLRGPVVFLIGAERHGLPAALIAGADVKARIGISGLVESLNAAMAGTIALYETRCQRELRCPAVTAAG